MKNRIIILTVLGFVFSFYNTKAQAPDSKAKYLRSSLHTILIESSTFPKKDTVLEAYFSAPFPDKYNQHDIGIKSIDPLKYNLTSDEKKAAGAKGSSKFGKMMGNATGGVVDSLAGDMQFIIEKYIKSEHLGRKLVEKWFNAKNDGTYDANLISERGEFNASMKDVKDANKSSDGKDLIRTTGFELIKNTFVIFNKLTFMKNEPAARIVREIAKAAVRAKTSNPLITKSADLAADKLYEATKDGYTVVNKAFLFQLKWNDSTLAVFDDCMKNKTLDKTDFDMVFVGDEKSSSIVLFSAGKSEKQIITLATIRNIDNSYANLQKSYAVFRPAVPILSNEPIIAYIGMKEGLSGGEKFEVLEKNIDPKTNKMFWKKVGKVKVKKGLVWDNRYKLTDGPPEVELDKDGKPKPVLTCTTFKGGKKFGPGMLLKQIK